MVYGMLYSLSGLEDDRSWVLQWTKLIAILALRRNKNSNKLKMPKALLGRRRRRSRLLSFACNEVCPRFRPPCLPISFPGPERMH